MGALDTWRRRARALRAEVHALYLAYRDPRVPWYGRLFAACVVAYAFSPLDLIPDPIPVLGHLDDFILIPLGVVLALRMIPPNVMEESRAKARAAAQAARPTNWIAAGLVVAVWGLLAWLTIRLMSRLL
ncbi:MAG TPA: YkvA family protein [bacterium]|nr:YkvA family protein [bacterium]